MSLFGSGIEKIKLSKNFNDTCVKIGECKSREEEEAIVQKWMQETKTTLSKSKLKPSELYENVISLIHLSLLGYNTDFGTIHAVNLTQQSNYMTKSLGYLACSALFDSKNPLIVLTVNSTQRDLNSQLPTDMCLALTAIAHLCTPELIQPIIGYISQCLNHAVPLVRQKAIMCVHSFIRKDPSCVVEFFPDLVRLLSDPDLSIVNAVVCTFTTLLKNQLNIRQICEVVPEVVRNATMILSGNARVEYAHQRVSAPFVLVNMYRLFQLIGPNMPEVNEQIEPLITQSLQTGTLESPASAAVLYEAIRTCIALDITEIPQLRGAISLFMGSREQNYKYVGLGLLSSIPDFADEFQATVIDCLEHPDPSIRLRTLHLLHSMASESNAQIIVINMLRFFQRTKNEVIRRELADRITDIASRFSPSPLWFAKTMEQLFALGGDLVRPEIAFAVMRLIDEDCDEEMRRSIVNLYLDVVQSNRRLSDVFVTVIAHVIGKYAELSDEYELSFIVLMLCDLADGYDAPRDWVLNAILQLLPKLEGDVPAEVVSVFENYKQSRSIIVQEICSEALTLLNFRETLNTIAEVEATPDTTLSFLDDFVNHEVTTRNLPVYIPLDDRDEDIIVSEGKGLIFNPYPNQSQSNYGDDATVTPQEEYDNSQLNTAGVRSVWGENGFQEVAPEEAVQPDIYGSGQTAEVAPAAQFAEAPKKSSLFGQMSVVAKKKDSADDKKEKLAASLFKGSKGGRKSIGKTIGKPLGAKAAPEQVAPPQPQIQLTQEDIDALNNATEEINQMPPEEIKNVMQSGVNPIPVYSDDVMKVAAIPFNGNILIAVMNGSQIPMMNFSIEIDGPASLQCQTVSHPANLTCVPPQLAISYMASYTFPKQMRGFPEFKFGAKASYNGKTVNFTLPMSLFTFITPLEGTTAQFGAAWKAGGSEIIYTLPRNEQLTLDGVSSFLTSVVHVHAVQRINQEEIFMGTLYSTPFKVLIHVKFGVQKVDIKVLTKAQPLTAALVNEIKANLH